MICEGLRTLLLAEATVTAVTSSIYVTAAKQGTAMPYIVLDRVSDEKYNALDGYQSARKAEIDIECWDTTASDASSLAKIVSDYLDDFSGATGGSETVLSSLALDDTDTYDPPKAGDDISEFVTILNFEFQYTE